MVNKEMSDAYSKVILNNKDITDSALEQYGTVVAQTATAIHNTLSGLLGLFEIMKPGYKGNYGPKERAEAIARGKQSLIKMVKSNIVFEKFIATNGIHDDVNKFNFAVDSAFVKLVADKGEEQT